MARVRYPCLSVVLRRGARTVGAYRRRVLRVRRRVLTTLLTAMVAALVVAVAVVGARGEDVEGASKQLTQAFISPRLVLRPLEKVQGIIVACVQVIIICDVALEYVGIKLASGAANRSVRTMGVNRYRDNRLTTPPGMPGKAPQRRRGGRRRASTRSAW